MVLITATQAEGGLVLDVHKFFFYHLQLFPGLSMWTAPLGLVLTLY